MLLITASPAAAQVSVRDLVELVDLSGLSLSPDGRQLVFRTEQASIERNIVETEWHVISTQSGGATHPIGSGGAALWTDAGVIISGSAVWERRSRYVYYRALVDGVVGLWRAAGDGSGAQLLTNEDADVRSFVFSADGERLIYTLGASRDAIARAETREYDSGILVDRSVDPAQAVFRGALINGHPATQRLTGHWFARTGLLSDRPERVRSLDLASLATRDASYVEIAEAAHPSSDAEPFARSATGDIARLVTTGPQTTVEIARDDRSPPIRCVSTLCAGTRIVAMAWWPDHDAVLLTREDASHAQRLILWDVARNHVRVIADDAGLLGGGRESGTPCTVAAEAAYCVAASAGSPPCLVRIDLTTGKHSVIYDPNRALRTRTNVVVERLDWVDATGQAFTGQLFRPRGPSSKPRPLVINYYRCDGFIRGGLGDEWPFAALAEVGIIGLCINKPPEPPEGQDATHRYDQALSGVRSAIDTLVDAGLVDRGRVGMGGLSFGSEAAMWVAIHSDMLRAVSIASVQLEPGYYWFNGVAGRDNHANLAAVWGLDAPDVTPARWKQVSPALNVDRIHAAILMQLPEQEARLSMEFYARLTLSTTPSELYAFPDEPHIKFQPRHKLAAYQRNLDWFRFWLTGDVDPDPLKGDQYARWRELAQRQASPPSSQDRAQSSIDTRSKIRK